MLLKFIIIHLSFNQQDQHTRKFFILGNFGITDTLSALCQNYVQFWQSQLTSDQYEVMKQQW